MEAGYIPEYTERNGCTCSLRDSKMFIATLFIITNWKQPKFPSTAEWIYKLQYSHTMEYCTEVKNAATCNMDESHSIEQKTQEHI